MLWAIKMNNISKGYHSVYFNKALAQKHLEFYKKAHPSMNYYLVSIKPLRLSKNFWGKDIVKFKDSVGWLNIIT